MASSGDNVDGETSLIEVLDRILDKGIVMDQWLRFSLKGLSLVEIDARVVVASMETYLGPLKGAGHAEAPL